MMSKNLWMSLAFSAASLAFALPANALVLGTEVTINDQNPYSGGAATNEDNEVEPDNIVSQVWDMEGFFLNDTVLTMVGGYNMWEGEKSGRRRFTSGDLFISVGKPVYGEGDISDRRRNGNKNEKNTYGYDYVFDLDFANNSWDLYAIDENSTVKTSYYGENQQSNPWQYDPNYGNRRHPGNKNNPSLASGNIIGSVDQTYTDEETGKDGWDQNQSAGWVWNGYRYVYQQETEGVHYAAGIDLSALYALLAGDETLYAHFTMECGNDSLMGSWDVPKVVSEPATLALFSLGLCGLLISRRKLASKN